MKSFNRTVLACAIGAPMALSVGANAQEADSSALLELEEVIVTANKREQSLQDVPAAITSMTGGMLEDRGINDPTDLEKIVPSMITGTGNRGEATINIRGVGYNEVGSPGIALHVDGVYQPRAGGGIISQLDTARVEVLRGPQSTLYGRNANGGVVNYVSQSPTDEFEASLLLGLADFGQTSATATLNVPLSDSFGARLTLNKLDRNDGFVENLTETGDDLGTIDSTGARLVLAGNVSEDLDVKLVANFNESEGALIGGAIIDTPYNPGLAAGLVPTEDFTTTQDGPSDVDQSYSAFTAIVNWNLGDWGLTSITGYQDYSYDRIGDFDFTSISGVINETKQSSTTLTQEFNLSGSVGDVDAVFGVFYMDDESDSLVQFTLPGGLGPFLPSPTAPSIITTNPSYVTESIAFYADANWNVSDNLRFIAGIRASEDEQSAVQFNVQRNIITGPNPDFVPGNGQLPFVVAAEVVECDQTTELDDSSILGRLGFQYDMSNNANLYATYSQGVKTGGINVRSGCADTFEDEEITSYEIGLKGRSDDGRLTANFTAFFYDYTDLQLEQIVGFDAATNNAPGSEVLGLEIDGSWLPDNHWNVTGTLSILDATYSESFVNINTALEPVGGFGPGGVPFFADVNGNTLNFAPELSSNISIGYLTDPVLAGGTIDFRFDVSYRSEVTLREFEEDGDVNDPVTLLGVSAKWESADKDYSVRLYVDNLTDEAYYLWMGASNQLGARFATWNTPRQYGLQFKADF